MRAALWLLALFGMAVVVALFAGNNQGTVTIFWPPHRVDISLNLVLLLLFAGFVLIYTALRALAALLDLPVQAHRWRLQQRERSMHMAVLDALAHLTAGRFIRARKAAEQAIAQEKAIAGSGESPPHAVQVRSLAHLLAAESAHALQDSTGRDEHLRQTLEHTAASSSAQTQEIREGAQLRAAAWSLQDRDARAALDWLDRLPLGAGRRTLALRIKLRASRLAHRTPQALETARLLTKHRAFSESASQSIIRGLAMGLIDDAHDVGQLHQAWEALEPAERASPELAVHAAERLRALDGDPAEARSWLLPAWELSVRQPSPLPQALRTRVVRTLEAGLADLDPAWLARIEAAQVRDPRDPLLQYLAGMACLRLQLWGKAQKLLDQAVAQLKDEALRCHAWCAMAELANQRGDSAAAAEAWRRAAMGASRP